MKKTSKVAGLLAMIMAVSVVAGCSGGSTNPTSVGTSAEKGSSSPSSESSSEAFKLSFMTTDHFGSPLSGSDSETVIAKMKEYTNTEVEFIWVANDSYEDKLGVTLMDQASMPMVMTIPKMLPTVVSAASAGAFWDLTEFLQDTSAYPNLSKANPQVNQAITINNQLIGIYRARPIGRNGLGYRKDWAEKLGLSEPKTVEDVYNMAKAFREQDPDGNGVKDTYGIALSKYTGPFDIMQTWFGAGNGWVEEEGNLVPVHQTKEYMEALTWLRKMYEEDLVYKDWAVRDSSTWSDSVKNGECGIFVDVLDSSRRIWDYFVTNEVKAVTGDGLASMGFVGAIAKDKSSEHKTLATSGYNGFFVITKAAAKTKEDVEKCLHFLDKMCDDEMLVLADYGLEGIDWEKNDKGEIKVITTDLVMNQKNNNGLNQVVAYIPNLMSQNPKLAMNEREILENEVKTSNAANAVFNPAAGYLVNSQTYSLNGANLDQILDDARTQYIVGQIDDVGLEAAWANWDSQGGSEVIKEVNALFHENP